MVVITESPFGECFNTETSITHPVKLYTLANKNDLTVQFMTWGATIMSIRFPDKNGVIEDVVLGFASMEDYYEERNHFFGATIGRVANKIRNAQLICDNHLYAVTKNYGEHFSNGGFNGFDKAVWDSYIDTDKVVLSNLSEHADEGFPGHLLVNAIFQLTEDNEFKIEYIATSSKPTYANITNRTIFNLGGFSSGAEKLLQHMVAINSANLLVTDDLGIPTGHLMNVSGTESDLRSITVLSDCNHKVESFEGHGPGFDHLYQITQKDRRKKINLVGRVYHPESGRLMEFHSNNPVVRFSTMNSLPEYKGEEFESTKYYKNCGFFLESQNYPDAPSSPLATTKVLKPGQIYCHRMIYKFLTVP